MSFLLFPIIILISLVQAILTSDVDYDPSPSGLAAPTLSPLHVYSAQQTE